MAQTPTFYDASQYSLSRRPLGTAVCDGPYNADGRKRRQCRKCKQWYPPKSGTQKDCDGCRKGHAKG